MRKTVIALLAASALTACSSGNEPSGRQVGAVLGTIAGAVIGSQIGSGAGRVAATIGLAVLGGWLGAEIGEELSREDQRIVGETAQDALENNDAGETADWSNPKSGASGSVTPGPTYVGGSGPAAGRSCREIDVVVTPDGKPAKQTTRTACRNANGDWEILDA